MNEEVNNFLTGGGDPTAKFRQIGDKCIGRVVDSDMTQQTTLKGEPRFFNDGKPMMQAVLTLDTEQRDPEIPDDDGKRRLFVKGAMAKAVREAIRASGANEFEHGGMLAVEYIGDGVSQGTGFDPPKLFRAQYRPPAVGANDLLGAAAGNGTAPASPTPAPQQQAMVPEPSVVASDLLPG
jgi:hypothetical protein